ncbi:glycosyl transferase [Marinithermofilum abyssi]|uniref:Glucosyl-3-phosphoglycerate synthase n=1 Tax=Marinithermofilum abyssi TaxID=1571185 RepID=A0A8J2YCP8_9BACL|nr:glycosyltransferase family 2 protein [Marinithermofilum abyssi]GGE10506.1 glycosyl transferase [Marinithermofilum abyssi]
MADRISVIIPAFNEEHRLTTTLKAVRQLPHVHEIVVVDDGSKDGTARIARKHADQVIVLPENRGKGEALYTGLCRAEGEILLFLDADLEEHAKLAGSLLRPILFGDADMTIARFPSPRKKGGFGLVKGLARSGVKWLTGTTLTAALSGQRGIRREVLEGMERFPQGFGVELGLTVHALRSGYRVHEIPLPMHHRETGRNWSGFVHRGKQFFAVLGTLIRLWRQPA